MSPSFAQEVIGRKGKVKIKLEWNKLETKNYVISYEKGIPREVIARVGKELEEILVEYKRLFPFKMKGRFQAQILDNQNTFNQVGGDLRHPGFYSPGNRTLVLLQKEFYSLIPIAYHEAFHQYIDAFMDYNARIPTWFNEGMATYYEGMQRDEHTRQKKLNPKKIKVSKIRMVQAKLRTRQGIPVEKLIDATYEEFHDREKEDLYYHQSFALVYYFMQTTKGKGPRAFMKELQKTKDPEKALEKLVGKKRKGIKKIEAHFKIFTKKVVIPKGRK
jgi:hypothetical protein